jgi:PadR family transcriptional regulator, regulatory protein PadR
MNTDKRISQMRKGVLELCILTIIASREDAYASDILARLKQSELIVVEGTLYPLLTRLKNEGLLSYRWEESKSGPPRKYYQITEIGEKVLNELTIGWQNLIDAVQHLSENDITNLETTNPVSQ